MKGIITALLVIAVLYYAINTGAIRIEFRDNPPASNPAHQVQPQEPTAAPPAETKAPEVTKAPGDATGENTEESTDKAPEETEKAPEETTKAPEETTSETEKTDDKETEDTSDRDSGKHTGKYTDGQLLLLSNEQIAYGPGPVEDNKQPPYAKEAQKDYREYGVHFIEEEKNTIYLTFDCGYDLVLDGKSVTGMILDVLKEKNVKATFFVTGNFVDENPDLVRRMLEEGHTLGSHSKNHKSMPGLTIREMEEQILTLHDKVEADFGYTMKFFRPPDGDFSLRSLAVTQNVGYETVHWSFAYNDWDTANQPEPEAALKKILSSHHDGAIYLLHAVSVTNAEILDEVIDGLLAMGYRLRVLS